ncbi:MAG: DUF1292 domain-containing protein [Clostridia bacterium]|nr:DUF1292 domain-containing protein [Clostridia bacterium]
MSERPMEPFAPEDGIPLVELNGPDGQVYRFRFGAMVPYAGEEYAVLIELEDTPEGEEQVLITRVEKAEDGNLEFIVAQEEDVIRTVFDKYLKMSVQAGLEGVSDAE